MDALVVGLASKKGASKKNKKKILEMYRMLAILNCTGCSMGLSPRATPEGLKGKTSKKPKRVNGEAQGLDLRLGHEDLISR